MRILFVSLDIPFPPDKGQRMRNFSLIKALAALRHRVQLISFAEPRDLEADHGPLRSLCDGVTLVPAPFTAKSVLHGHLRRLRALASSVPYGASRFRSARLLAHVHDHLKHHPCDVIIWDEAYNLENLTAPLPVPVVLNSHDIMHVIWRRYLALERHPAKRLYAWLEHRKLLRWEPRAHFRVAKVLAVSAHDASVLSAMCPGLPISIVPNTVDVEDYDITGAGDGRGILFVGGLDWLPNRDAVAFFARDVLPRLRRIDPSARFVVAGKLPAPRAHQRLASLGVELLGRVDDVRPVLTAAGVCVVPLRIGSGVRWKILEAAAMGKAIVSTRLGAEGLDFEDGHEIVLADDPDAFAEAIAKLMMDTDRRRAIGLQARRRVERQYSYETLGKTLHEALMDFEDESSRRGGQA
jgi:glycosyltransferase involved in cell wall biosynthesis